MKEAIAKVEKQMEKCKVMGTKSSDLLYLCQLIDELADKVDDDNAHYLRMSATHIKECTCTMHYVRCIKEIEGITIDYSTGQEVPDFMEHLNEVEYVCNTHVIFGEIASVKTIIQKLKVE